MAKTQPKETKKVEQKVIPSKNNLTGLAAIKNDRLLGFVCWLIFIGIVAVGVGIFSLIMTVSSADNQAAAVGGVVIMLAIIVVAGLSVYFIRKDVQKKREVNMKQYLWGFWLPTIIIVVVGLIAFGACMIIFNASGGM